MIENQQVYITYTADGVQREWEFPYQYVKPEDISLYIEHDGVLTQIASQLYAFSEVTKKVTYPLDEEEAPVPQGDSVLLWRETNITQEEDSSIANFKSNDLERMTDKLTMICQELSDKYNRAVHFEPTDVYDTDATTYVKTIAEAKDTAVQAASDAHDEAVSAAGYASDASGSAVLANNYKDAASASADESKKWAEGTDEEVTPLGGEHSSKEWSNVAKYYAETIGAALVYKGSVSTYSNLPSSGQKIGDFWNVLDTGKNYAWTGTEWDDISGIMDLSAYRTAAAQDIIDGGKQATLVSGTNIKTVNSNSLLGSGNIDIDALPSQTGQSGKFLTTDGTNASWAPAAAEIDNKSITQNSSNQIQTVGVIDQNNTSNAIKTWTGTKDEFDDIVTKDAHTLYNVHDELDGGSVNTSFLASLGRCSYNFQQLAAVSGEEYTAPATGFFVLNGFLANAANNRLYLLLRNKPYVYGNRLANMVFGALSSHRQYVWLPVAKGEVVGIMAQSTAPNPDFDLRFYYAIGEQTPTPEHTPIQYIQGQYNTQYIKSGIIPTSGMKVYCKLQNTSSTIGFGWGCRNETYDGAQMSVNATNQNVVVDWFGATSDDRWTLSTSVATTDIFELTIENNVAEIKKNGSVVGTHTFTPTATVTRELFLTGFNNNGMMGSAGATGRLYEYKLWAPEGDLLLDMTPAKDADGVACLYNSVNKILYYNQGTGSYTAGPDAN